MCWKGHLLGPVFRKPLSTFCLLIHDLWLLCCAGDFGHGLLMFAFAMYLLANEQKFLRQQLDEIFGMAFGGRYCIALMAAFSIFTGLMYNEFFSMPMTLFGGTRMRVGAACVYRGSGLASVGCYVGRAASSGSVEDGVLVFFCCGVKAKRPYPQQPARPCSFTLHPSSVCPPQTHCCICVRVFCCNVCVCVCCAFMWLCRCVL